MTEAHFSRKLHVGEITPLFAEKGGQLLCESLRHAWDCSVRVITYMLILFVCSLLDNLIVGSVRSLLVQRACASCSGRTRSGRGVSKRDFILN